MKQVNAVPDRAATLVVDPTPGIGDVTTIQDAIDILVSLGTGGRVFIREGTYPISSPITMPDLSITFVGAGEDTVIDLGNNAIFAFTVPAAVLTEPRMFEFHDFKVESNSIFGSGFVQTNDGNAFARIVVHRVRTEGIQINVDIAAGDAALLTPVLVNTYDCSWIPSSTYFTSRGLPIATNAGVICTMGGAIFPNKVAMRNLYFATTETDTTGGSICGDSFSGLDISFYDSMLSLVQEDGFNTIHAERCRIFNYLGQGGNANANTIFLGGLGFDPNNDHPECAFIDCNIIGMSLNISEAVNFVGCWIDTTTITASVVNGKCQITGCTFRTDATVPQFPHFGATPTSYINGGGELAIVSCRFSSSGPNATGRYIEAVDSFYIAFCAFANLPAGATNAGIHVTGPNNVIIGNDFDALWAAPPVKEEGASVEGNVYDGNIGMNGNGGTDSVFVAPAATSPTTFNGSALFHRTNTTTDVFVLITMTLSALGTSDPGVRVNPSGLVGGGTIKNTGANSMDIRETVTDAFGVTEAVITTVAAGAKQVLKKMDEGPFSATAFPPYVKYQIEARSTVAGSPTTFNYQQNLNSEVTW